MKVFITGGTGFIGGHVLKKLVARGDTVYALARSERSAAAVEALGARAVLGDLDDIDVLREAMQGCDVVFHIAAWYKLGANDPMRMAKVNVGGTLNVLHTAHEVGVPKIVYTSSVAVFGDTHGYLADESFYQGPPFLTDYDRTKWRAHYEIAHPLIEQGAPIVIVMPGAVYGPDDHSLVGEMMTWFYRGWLPVLPGPETMLTYAHVEDIAEGHLLAAEKGQVGESYLLVGPALTMAEVVALWRELTGKRGPLFSVPSKWLLPLAPVIGALECVVPLPSLFCRDSVAILGTTYVAKGDKAKAELGWSPRPIRKGMLETFYAIAGALPPTPPVSVRRKRTILLLLGAALGVLAVWLLQRQRE
jgi:nucleoside-diphosphate-sugar epimerase